MTRTDGAATTTVTAFAFWHTKVEYCTAPRPETPCPEDCVKVEGVPLPKNWAEGLSIVSSAVVTLLTTLVTSGVVSW